MSDADNNPLAQALAFGKFVPGFDFLQNLAKGAAHNIPQLPNPANWIAPTLSVEELEKRIAELKAVQFWLDQNATALKATIQALEVQKMTLATLKGMNFNMGDVANALKLKAADTVMGGVSKVTEKVSERVSGAAKKTKTAKTKTANSALPDPMQWWGSLTQQFTDIASSAMKDAARQTALDTSKHLAQGFAKEAARAASRTAQQTAQNMRNNLSKFTTKTIAASADSMPASGLKALKKTATKKRVARKARSSK